MNRIIAAVKNDEDFNKALSSSVSTVFLLSSDIFSLKGKIDEAHKRDKKIYIHFDFINGLGKDKYGLQYVKHIAPDGIISVKPNIIRQAREVGLVSIQRFFIVDSKAIETAFEMVESVKPDMIEVMPGIAFKAIKTFADKLDIPVIAGGLINEFDEVGIAVKYGAKSISTGNSDLWEQNVE